MSYKLFDTAAIKAEIKELLAEAQSINDLAAEEDRAPSDEEQKRILAILDSVGEDATEEAEATGLRAKLATAERFARIKQQNRSANDQTPANFGGVHQQTGGEPFALPKSVLNRAGSLKAYGRGTSEHPVHDAYASGMWIAANVHRSPKAMAWCEEHGYGINATHIESDNSLGGVFVPVEMSSRIIDLRYSYGTFRQYARTEPMSSDEKTYSRRRGHLTAYAMGEGDSYTESNMTWGSISLVARKWGVLTKISDELQEDSVVNLAELVTRDAAWAFAKKEDESGFVGDGTSTYHGIMGLVNKANDGSHAGALYTAASGNTAFSTLDLADFEGMMGQLPSWAEEGAAWYVHKVGWAASMARLQDAAGGNNIADLGNGPVLQFLGYPVRFVPVLNSTTTAQTSTAGLCILANLDMSSDVGDRSSGVSMKVLNELYAGTGEIGLRFHTRSDINNHTITDPADASGATAGPVVVLKTPAS